MEDSGTKDINGNWIPETDQAKLRNKLSPFWLLISILSDDEKFNKIILTQKGKDLIDGIVNRCKSNQNIILKLIENTEK